MNIDKKDPGAASKPAIAREPSQAAHRKSNRLGQGSTFKLSNATSYSETYDYVMVFKLDKEGKQTDYCKDVVDRMIEAGLEIFMYKSVQDDELYVLIRAPLSLLRRFADKIDYKLRMDPIKLEETLLAGDAEKMINPVKITEIPELCPYSPYEHIFLKFDERLNESMYYRDQDKPHCFNRGLRLKLIYLLLRAPKRDLGCDIEVSKLLHKKRMLAMYPLHDRKHTDHILSKCMATCTMPWDAPIEDIRAYFGEKIALYNVFLGHYSWWLIIPSIVGLAFQLVVWGTLNFSHPVLPFYSLIITLWSIVMLEYWKRQESVTALRWGMSDFEQLEQDRPEYVGDVIKSYINGRDMTYFPPERSQLLSRVSNTIITGFIAMVVGVVAGIYIFRFQLQKSADTRDASSTVASILNTVQITIFNILYQMLAKKLTDRENHRTDTQYEDSLIVKMFVFQFINSYASFFFLAFIAGNLPRPTGSPSDFLGQCGYDNCMQPLSINLAIIFGSRLTVTNFLDMFIPWLTYKQKIKAETKGIDPNKELTPAEKDYMLMQYDPMIASIQNYADTAVQYGFTLLFITALPCASFFSLINNYVKVKFNTWKLVNFYQRPIPSGAQDIGTWQDIFNIISVAAVVTNAGLICFTMSVLWHYSLFGRVWIFIGFQWVLIACQFITQFIIEDVPEEVTIQLQRAEFINLKVIEKVADEDFGMAPEEVVVEETTDENGAGGCCGGRGKTSNRKARQNVREIEPSVYPFSSSAATWPPAITKESHPVEKETVQANYNTVSDLDKYAANVAAVSNPAAVYH